MMKFLYDLLCVLGFHDWEKGQGWSNIAEGVDGEFKKRRCRYCLKQQRKESSWVSDDSSADNFSA